MDHEELERFQLASDDYDIKAKVEGPLVGEIVSTVAIRDEFSNSDQYWKKADALPQQWPWLREIGRDGNCGWTALLFATLEILLRSGDSSKFADLIAKLKSMNTMLSRWYNEDMQYGDARDETLDFLQKLDESISSFADARGTLTEVLGDSSKSCWIIYYFRLIVSSWIRENSEHYEGFILLDGASTVVEAYCTEKIERLGTDIEEPGIHALWAAIIKEMGIAIGIVNLDTSPGDACNIIAYQPPQPEGFPKQNVPTIWMLRRLIGSGHYDLLYKAEDLPEMQIQIMRASNATYNDTDNVPEMQQELIDASFYDHNSHHADFTQLRDPSFYLTPISTLNRCSIGRPSNIPVAGGFRLEYIPYINVEDDSLFECSVPLPFAAQLQESRRNDPELPNRFRQEDQGEQAPRLKIRHATMSRCNKECDKHCKRSCSKTRLSRVEGCGDNFVAGPDPEQSKATKRIKEELKSQWNFRAANFSPIIETEPSGYNKGKGKANAKPRGPAR
ncbi:hypothetical protein MMC30_002868 [Trapelia coarctata]|nr:hypothetical protein [Trapelia coarctata]